MVEEVRTQPTAAGPGRPQRLNEAGDGSRAVLIKPSFHQHFHQLPQQLHEPGTAFRRDSRGGVGGGRGAEGRGGCGKLV